MDDRARVALERQVVLLERIAINAPLDETLDLLVQSIEGELPGAIGSLLLLDPDRQTLHAGSVRGLPPSYNDAIEGIAIGPGVGSCGTAAFRRETVIVADIETDPLWADYRPLARAHGLRACWSSPIVSRRDPEHPTVLGTFALYFRAPATPDPRAHGVLSRAEFVACIAIEASRAAADLSARRELEEQLRRAQKMEAIGRLAGGVAHDFNNLLTVINGYTEVLLEASLDGTTRGDLEIIRDAGNRAAALTAQLLAFSRRSVVAPTAIDLNVLVARMARMFERIIGEDVVLVTALAAEPATIHADAGQIEQVLLNLVVNAREAMPRGGRLTIATGHTGGPTGRRVTLTVTDTGDGMTDEVKARVFEPFFTTKPDGKGCGLGLATVYGIVQQAGGEIRVDSGPGRGSVFTVVVPAGAPPEAPATAAAPPWLGGTEVVLLVEDEDGVRRLVERGLRQHGYTVLVAAGGEEALALADGFAGAIDLLVTDVIMPGMRGDALADAVRARRPDTRVLFMSGYIDDEIVRQGIVVERDAFVQKPFTPLGLLQKIRTVLDGRGGA